jgi:uncharacterized membrane protein required for colicin V production
MIADLIIIAIIVLFIVIGARRGLARTVLGLLGLMITYFAANALSEFLSQVIYDAFIKETVANNINSFITTNGLDYAVDNCFTALPDWAYAIVSAFVSIFGGDFATSLNANNAISSASSAVETTVETVSVGVFQILLLLILFIIIYIIVKRLVRLALKLFNAPIIKQLNRFCGGVLGAAEGVLFAFIVVNVFNIVMLLTNPNLLNDSLLNGTLFQLLCWS